MKIKNNAALLVIDVQKGFDDPVWGRRNNPMAEANVARLIRAFRETGRPVMHVRHLSKNPNSPLRPGQPGSAPKPEAAPLPGETTIEKSVNSAFIGTRLEELLDNAGIDQLVVVGLVTSHCVSTTARMAANLGYETFVISDATATHDRRSPDGEWIPAETMHRVALTELHGEFAEVMDSDTMLSALA